MKTATIAVVVVLVLMGGLGGGYIAGSAGQRTVTSASITTTTYTDRQTTLSVSTTTLATTYTPHITSGCNVPPGVGVPLFAPLTYNKSQRGQLALVLKPGMNATVLVGYCPVNIFGIPGPVTFSPSVTVETCSIGPYGGGCQGIPAKDVTIAAVPNEALYENNSLTVVAYFISADASSKGYYSVNIPDMCPSAGLDVGYPPSQLNHSDFPWMGYPPCPIAPGEILSVSGTNTTYVGL